MNLLLHFIGRDAGLFKLIHSCRKNSHFRVNILDFFLKKIPYTCIFNEREHYVNMRVCTNLVVYLTALHKSEVGVKAFQALFKDSKVRIFLIVVNVGHGGTPNLDIQMLRKSRGRTMVCIPPPDIPTDGYHKGRDMPGSLVYQRGLQTVSMLQNFKQLYYMYYFLIQ